MEPYNIIEILKWSQNKFVNPRTKRKIKENGRVYSLLKKQYDEYFPDNYTYLDSIENMDPVSLQNIWIMKNGIKEFIYPKPENLIFYKDNNNNVNCFEKETIQYFKHHKINTHPVTLDIIPRYIFDQVDDIDGKNKDELLITTISQKALTIFQIFHNISIFINHEDFVNLNNDELDKLYYETLDFFNKNIPEEHQEIIRLNGNEAGKDIFNMLPIVFKDLEFENKQNYILDCFEFALNYKDENVIHMINYIILGGLSLVIPEIKEAYPDFCFQF